MNEPQKASLPVWLGFPCSAEDQWRLCPANCRNIPWKHKKWAHENYLHLYLGPASLVCKGPDGQYFWLCGPQGFLLSVGTTQLCRGSRISGRGNRCGELLPQGCSWPISALGSQTLAILPSSMICRQSCEAGRGDTLEERGPALQSTGWPTPVTCQRGPLWMGNPRPPHPPGLQLCLCRK